VAFDKTLPTNSTKIRNYPTVLTDNWSAIQTGDLTFKTWQLNFADRDEVEGAPPPTQDPTRDDDTMIMFSKNNADGETDLYILDDRSSPSNFALTENGKVGGRATSAVFQDISIGTNTFVNDQNNFVWAHGRVPKAGGAISGQGLGTATTGSVSGYNPAYTITLTRTPSNANYQVFIMCEGTGSSSRARVGGLIPGTRTVNDFSVFIQRTGDSDMKTDADYYIMVVGGF
tara:strand:- start:6799 stop:7485 length:687 start_codon:yes stop_codon:yes gene_type:complete